jgi:hypothetical protein
VLLRMIPVPVIEGAANHADRVVVGFLRPLIGVRDFGELGISDLIENSGGVMQGRVGAPSTILNQPIKTVHSGGSFCER